MTMHPSEADLHDHADGLLPADDGAAVEAHLAGCAECEAFLHRALRLKAALSAMPRHAQPARDLWPAVAERTVDAAPAGVIPFPAAAPFHRRSAPSAAWQRAAAAVLLFVGGVGVGRAGAPAAAPSAPAEIAAAQPADAMEAAARIQRAGSEYVAAVAAFAALTDSASEAERAQGRDVALAAIYGAAEELTRVAARDTSARAIWRAVSSTRHLVSTETTPGEVRF